MSKRGDSSTRVFKKRRLERRLEELRGAARFVDWIEANGGAVEWEETGDLWELKVPAVDALARLSAEISVVEGELRALEEIRRGV